MQTKRTIIIFADIQGSTGFGFTQPLEKHNEMLRDFHKTCHEAIKEFSEKRGLTKDRVKASCRGDECCIFIVGGKESDDEVLALELAIYMKEKWKVSDFCKRNWQASATGLIPQVDLRIGIGAGDVALDNGIWSGTTTPEGIAISEAKRIEGLADEAKETLIVVKWDIKETCLKANVPVKFGEAVRLKGKGIPTYHDIPLYPLLTYERWKDIQTEVTPSPKTMEERFARAKALSLSGDFASAIPLFTDVLKTKKNMYDVWAWRAYAYHKMGKYEMALDDYNLSLKLRPDDPATLMNRGLAYYNLGKYELALDDYNLSLKLRPDDPATLMNRGNAYYNLGKYELALDDYNLSLKLRPDHPDTLYNLACLFSQWGNPDKALDYLQRAIARDEKYRAMVRTDKDFDNIRQDQTFKHLIEVSKSNQ